MALISSAKLSLDTALAVALVPYFAPKHHTQATRLLKTVLDAQPTNSEARFARAQISQEAGKWAEARKNFQYILDQGGEEKEMVAAKEELAWCFVNEGDLTKGRDLLEEVVEVRDRRAGELEGKEDAEAFARARAWWRLGQTEWRIGGMSLFQFWPRLMSRRRKPGTCRKLVHGFHASFTYICPSLFGSRFMLRLGNPAR
jgi:superkiller protein 3